MVIEKNKRTKNNKEHSLEKGVKIYNYSLPKGVTLDKFMLEKGAILDKI